MYLLDTCAVSDFVKGDPNTLGKIQSMTPDDLFLSTISLMEIEYGLLKKPQKAQFIQAVIHDFLDTIHLIEFGPDEARCAGFIRADLMKKGTPIGPYDILIAATAMHHNLRLITSNMNEFTRVHGLVCESWRENELLSF